MKGLLTEVWAWSRNPTKNFETFRDQSQQKTIITLKPEGSMGKKTWNEAEGEASQQELQFHRDTTMPEMWHE